MIVFLILVSAAQTAPMPLDLAGKKCLMILSWWNVCLSCLEFIIVYHHPQIWRYSSETCWTHTSHHSSQELKPGSGSVVTALVIRTVICFGSFVLASNWLRFISVSYRSLAFRCLIFFSILLEYARNLLQKLYASTIHLSLSITPWIHS